MAHLPVPSRLSNPHKCSICHWIFRHLKNARSHTLANMNKLKILLQADDLQRPTMLEHQHWQATTPSQSHLPEPCRLSNPYRCSICHSIFRHLKNARSHTSENMNKLKILLQADDLQRLTMLEHQHWQATTPSQSIHRQSVCKYNTSALSPAPVERLFSQAVLILTTCRNKLSDE